MTFKQWLANYRVAAQNLTPMDIQLIELGWIAAKVDSAAEHIDAEIERESAAA